METLDLTNSNILVTGASGFVGTHLIQHLKKSHINHLFTPSSKEADLTQNDVCQKVVKDIDIVIHLAGDVGGIGYNRENPGKLFYRNLMMGTQLMEASRKAGVKKFVAIGTICSYPKFAKVPFKEEDLWSGYPEETNAPYGLAKKMLMVQAEAYQQQYSFNAINLLPVNLYGPGDNFNPDSSHVIPALIEKFVQAKEQGLDQVEVWGTGKATREFLYVEDAAQAIILATQKYNSPQPINIGANFEISIADLAQLIAKLTQYPGKIVFDTSKPDGQPRRKLDTSKAKKAFGFEASTDFETGLQKTIDWYKQKNQQA